MTAQKATTEKKSHAKAPETNRPAVSALLEKVVLNAGLGRASQQTNFEDKILKQVKGDIAKIAGQEPQVRRIAKSIAGFKVREGAVVGVRVTLRGKKMVDFFERFIRIVLPRVRDFSGLALSNVDQGGVLNVGIREQLVFTEINPEDSFFIFPLQVSFVPKHKRRDEALAAYRELGVPLKATAEPKPKKKK